ncbi:alpha/beta hydrolase [Cytobacillus sp. IB215665]|uniref:alpha/beta hydrolase n=1 Tax=Cytobacillus sp. IB215665 TaxID=3097357 RepID=UPI002A1834FF|nr:alpha/beta fold hydrolase [Cytobacillus sp. IB215665]MDX8365218.1 alpha/beta hydrolase [Cytobacillus sp. IB215665]
MKKILARGVLLIISLIIVACSDQSEEQLQHRKTEENTLSIPVERGTLTAILDIPEGADSLPIAIIIAGSGPTDKDGNTVGANGKNNSLKMLSEAFNERGIATLRYDKRGVGDNISLVNKEEDLTIESYVNDVAAIVHYIQKDSRFASINIVGHSEGSLIGMIAVQEVAVDKFISLAGVGQSADKLLLEQLEGQLPPKLMDETKNILNQLKQGKQVTDVSQELNVLFRPSVQPYLISWFTYNPVDIISSLNIPLLIINGTNDIQVTEKEAHLLKEANPQAELFIIEGMNHILKQAPLDKAGNLATYTNANLPLDEELSTKLIQFVLN